MVGDEIRCRLYRERNDFGTGKPECAAVLLRWGSIFAGHSGINLVEVSLESPLGIFRQAGEFNAHSNAGVAGSNGCARGDALLIDPEVCAKHSMYRQWHYGLNITAVAADVGGVYAHRCIHALVAEFQRKRNLVALKPSTIIWSDRW